jgi:NitT/TauT family transport system permease protein
MPALWPNMSNSVAKPTRRSESGALIAQATGTGDYAMLLGATLALVITVVFINRIFWRRLYRVAEERYRME